MVPYFCEVHGVNIEAKKRNLSKKITYTNFSLETEISILVQCSTKQACDRKLEI